ncbi:MAG: YgjV family protein [Clostridia bacterium]|nr:YgjV family protein [Clostridia bacterium]
MFILAQILSFIAMIINMVAVQLKKKKHILLTIVVSNLLFIISYILLKAYVGALTCGIVAIEIIINTVLEDKGKKTPKLLIILYILVSIIIGVTTFGGFIDILPIIASILFVFTLMQSKEKYVRMLILGNLISWVIYDIFVMAYLAGLSDFFVILSTITAIIRYDIKKEVKKDEDNCDSPCRDNI